MDYSLKELADEMYSLYDYMVKNNVDCEMFLSKSTNRINISLPNADMLNDIATDINMLNITVKENDLRRVSAP